MARRVSSPELVGRSEPLAALMHALDDAPRVVLLAGDAGMGKTRLASEFAARAAAAGARVLWGECVPMQAGELPYAPFATAMRGIVEPAPAADRDPAEARAERF